MSQNLKFYKIHENAVKPKRATPESAGLDICSIENGIVFASKRGIFRTGLKVQLPLGTYGRIASRSGLASKHSIDVGAGVIDSDYRGEIMVVLCNHSDKDFYVEKGTRIAQLIVEKIKMFEPEMTTNLEDFSSSERNDKGFGSTGF